ncbi:deoxyguanosinetriphosphate triphosphohydrolase family protein [Caloranaerobacter sp. TR13]|uniref:deoxyguanosinetriphosphate triphosphohydrolase family protein n=1 Tax=Caloranaerobacter sp. TR13 TaxID=1302151 RepID=UPI00387E079C
MNEVSKCEIRLPFQRDRDRIIHSRAFRRLMHKTQIFNANMGDHYRNRLTHTLEVSQIARSIGKVLRLNDELIEAIALGHDLGHTPFGHIGERTLHLIISGQMFKNDKEISIQNCGGFKHNYQSLQIIDNLEKRTEKQKGMNLTLAVREGILKHTSRKIKIPEKNYEKRRIVPIKQEVKYTTLDLSNINIELPSFTLEGQVVAIADEIAQCTHDLEDGIRAKIIKIEDISNAKLVEKICKDENIKLNQLKETVDVRNVLIKSMVGYLINDVCKASYNRIQKAYIDKEYPTFKDKNDVFKEKLIVFSDEIDEMHSELSNMISKLVITSQKVSQADAKGEYIICKLFKAYYIHPQQLPDYILNRYFSKKGMEVNRLKIQDMIFELQDDSEFLRLICDHIASMTDQYAAREYIKLYEPEYY